MKYVAVFPICLPKYIFIIFYFTYRDIALLHQLFLMLSLWVVRIRFACSANNLFRKIVFSRLSLFLELNNSNEKWILKQVLCIALSSHANPSLKLFLSIYYATLTLLKRLYMGLLSVGTGSEWDVGALYFYHADSWLYCNDLTRHGVKIFHTSVNVLCLE